MARKKKEVPFSGWLNFFIVTLLIFNPIFGLIGFFVYAASYEIVPNTIMLEMLGSIVGFALAGFFLYKRKPYAVQFTKILLITSLAANIVASVSYGEYSAANFAYYIIWIWYLYKSQNVQEVYGNLVEDKSNTNTWTILSLIYAITVPVLGVVLSFVSMNKAKKFKDSTAYYLCMFALIISLGLVFFQVMQGINDPGHLIPTGVEESCMDYCSNVESASLYLVEDSFDTEYPCTCYDDLDNIIEQTTIDVGILE